MLVVALVHGALAIPTGIAAAVGDFPAKPAKFAISIAILLGTLVPISRALGIDPRTRTILEAVLSITMIVEMTAILGQALRGTESHFNLRTAFDAAIWHVMAIAIAIAFLALVVFAFVASLQPIAASPVVAFAVRVGLWMLLLVAVSGFAMGGKGSHGPSHADLRVPHFFAIHALQVIPAAAIVSQRWPVVVGVAVIWLALAIGTLIRALSSAGT